MKKWFLVLLLLVVLAISAIYFFIPAKQSIVFETSIHCTQTGAERILLDKNKLQAWWPGQKKDNHLYNYKNYEYRIDNYFLNGIQCTITNNKDSVKGMIAIEPLKGDAILLRWTSPVVFSNNPFKRVLQYFSFVNFKENIEALFGETKNYFEKEEHIYGMTVVTQKVTDSTMVALKKRLDHYPSTEEVYDMINSIKQFIALQQGEENDFPMLNVHSEDLSQFDVMVAIPTKKNVACKAPFILKNMVLGKILKAEVKGGIYSIREGEQQLINYLNDYQKSSPAIPYQSLVTNRQMQTDTSKWITSLYYPVFY